MIDPQDHPQRRSLASRLFGAFVAPRTYANIGYLLLAMPLGIAYFCWLVSAFALGLGLWIVLVGLPILGFTVLTVYWMTGFERWLAIHMLGEEVPPLRRDVAEGEGFLDWVKGVFTTSATWKGLVFLLAKLPLGMVSFVVAVSTLSISIALVLAPVGLLLGGSIEVGTWTVDTPFETALAVLLGLAGLFLTVHLLNGMAYAWRQLSRVMLGQGLPGNRSLTAPSGLGT